MLMLMMLTNGDDDINDDNDDDNDGDNNGDDDDDTDDNPLSFTPAKINPTM